ncbi:MAG: hypothetical protein ACYCRH_01500 [Acidiferrobacteraceae bacterium]
MGREKLFMNPRVMALITVERDKPSLSTNVKNHWLARKRQGAVR